MITQILAFIFAFTPEYAHAIASVTGGTGGTGGTSDCSVPTRPGVLVGTVCPTDNFFQYIAKVLNENNGYIIAIAVIIVVFSGVQYMLAMGNTSNQGKAKERIVGVVIGIIFLTLVRFLLTILADNLSLT